MKKKLNVLVTGAGSGVGQGIIKSLQASKLKLNLIAADISKFQSGLYVCDDFQIIPKLEKDESKSLKIILSIIKQKKINIIFIGSEFDLIFFSKHKSIIEEKTECHVAVFQPQILELGNDKFKTVEFLSSHQLPHAKSLSPQNLTECISFAKHSHYPLILKPRVGTSNRNVFIINNEDDLRSHFDKVPNPILQELINTPSQELSHEYTCSVFKTTDRKILGCFTAKRTLRSGNSWVVEVGNFTKIHPLLKNIAKNLDFVGSLNVQLMQKENGEFIPFEFNPRFSGTTAIRSHFGFNEPELYIKNVILKEEIKMPKIRKGVAFRYLEEIFLENITAKQLESKTKKPIGVRANWYSIKR